MKNLIELPNIICVDVEHEKDFGYWEVNTETKKAYFRDHGTLPPEDKKVEDLSDKYKTIHEYLRGELEAEHTKVIIPDRKILFSDKPFCTWSKQRTSDDGVVTTVYCQHNALVRLANPTDPTGEPRLYCSEHAPIGPNSKAPQHPFTSTASVVAGTGVGSGTRRPKTISRSKRLP